MKADVIIHQGEFFGAVRLDMDTVLHALGVVLRAKAEQEGPRCFHRKIVAIGQMRVDKGLTLSEAICSVEYAVVIVQQCEGLKLAALLNPID